MDKNDDKSQEYNKPLVTKTKGIIQDLEIIKKKMEQQVHMLNNSNSSSNSLRNTNNSQSSIIQDNKFNKDSNKLTSTESDSLSLYRQKLTNTFDQNHKLLMEANNIKRILGAYGTMSESYAASADTEIKSAWLMRGAIVSLMVAISLFTYFFLLPSLKATGAQNVFSICVTFIPFVIALGLVVYLLYMERNHTSKAANHKDLSLKMSMLAAYLKEIPQEDADLLKVEISRFLFNSLGATDKN